MKINLRIKNGWEYGIQNKSREFCDIDGAKLWIAPHGGIYCDRVHDFSDDLDECERMEQGLSFDD